MAASFLGVPTFDTHFLTNSLCHGLTEAIRFYLLRCTGRLSHHELEALAADTDDIETARKVSEACLARGIGH